MWQSYAGVGSRSSRKGLLIIAKVPRFQGPKVLLYYCIATTATFAGSSRVAEGIAHEFAQEAPTRAKCNLLRDLARRWEVGNR